jgi:hypothetical protein
MQSFNWRGLLISQSFKNQQIPDEYKFESAPDSHHRLKIHHDVSINEFIIMLRDRFFQNLDLEDIWVYRIIENLPKD